MLEAGGDTSQLTPEIEQLLTRLQSAVDRHASASEKLEKGQSGAVKRMLEGKVAQAEAEAAEIEAQVRELQAFGQAAARAAMPREDRFSTLANLFGQMDELPGTRPGPGGLPQMNWRGTYEKGQELLASRTLQSLVAEYAKRSGAPPGMGRVAAAYLRNHPMRDSQLDDLETMASAFTGLQRRDEEGRAYEALRAEREQEERLAYRERGGIAGGKPGRFRRRVTARIARDPNEERIGTNLVASLNDDRADEDAAPLIAVARARQAAEEAEFQAALRRVQADGRKVTARAQGRDAASRQGMSRSVRDFMADEEEREDAPFQAAMARVKADAGWVAAQSRGRDAINRQGMGRAVRGFLAGEEEREAPIRQADRLAGGLGERLDRLQGMRTGLPELGPAGNAAMEKDAARGILGLLRELVDINKKIEAAARVDGGQGAADRLSAERDRLLAQAPWAGGFAPGQGGGRGRPASPRDLLIGNMVRQGVGFGLGGIPVVGGALAGLLSGPAASAVTAGLSGGAVAGGTALAAGIGIPLAALAAIPAGAALAYSLGGAARNEEIPWGDVGNRIGSRDRLLATARRDGGFGAPVDALERTRFGVADYLSLVQAAGPAGQSSESISRLRDVGLPVARNTGLDPSVIGGFWNTAFRASGRDASAATSSLEQVYEAMERGVSKGIQREETIQALQRSFEGAMASAGGMADPAVLSALSAQMQFAVGSGNQSLMGVGESVRARLAGGDASTIALTHAATSGMTPEQLFPGNSPTTLRNRATFRGLREDDPQAAAKWLQLNPTAPVFKAHAEQALEQSGGNPITLRTLLMRLGVPMRNALENQSAMAEGRPMDVIALFQAAAKNRAAVAGGDAQAGNKSLDDARVQEFNAKEITIQTSRAVFELTADAVMTVQGIVRIGADAAASGAARAGGNAGPARAPRFGAAPIFPGVEEALEIARGGGGSSGGGLVKDQLDQTIRLNENMEALNRHLALGGFGSTLARPPSILPAALKPLSTAGRRALRQAGPMTPEDAAAAQAGDDPGNVARGIGPWGDLGVSASEGFGPGDRYPNTDFFRSAGLAGKPHAGYDLFLGDKKKGGDLVRNPFEGATVLSTQTAGGSQDVGRGYGNAVKLQLQDGSTAIMAHLQAASGLKAGQALEPSDLVGLEGTTGNSNANHLHFEMRRQDGTAITDKDEFLKTYRRNLPGAQGGGGGGTDAGAPEVRHTHEFGELRITINGQPDAEMKAMIAKELAGALSGRTTTTVPRTGQRAGR